MKTRNLTIVFIILILILAGMGYWYFFMGGNGSTGGDDTNTDGGPTGFQPIDRNIPGPSGNNGSTGTDDDEFPTSVPTTTAKVPALRLLSDTPVGGYGASTTASTTVVRWVDRGRGNIYETNGDTLDVKTISNTLVPMVYTSIWNKNLTAFIGSIFDRDTSTAPALFAEIKRRPESSLATSTDTSQETKTEYELKGKNLPENTIAFAASPKRDRIFILVNESGTGIGYVSGFSGTNATKIFETPLTQLNVEWPEENTIAITTKGSAETPGYLYFVDPKTGIWKKIAGPVSGMSTKVSHDAKRVFISGTGANGSIRSLILNIATKEVTDAVIRTLAEKCAWGNFDKEMIYCATPSKIDSSVYPDNWYTGSVSFVDKIWQLNTETEEVHMVSQIINQSDRIIDAYNLDLDSKDNFLFFMNKNDLSLWSLDLISSD